MKQTKLPGTLGEAKAWAAGRWQGLAEGLLIGLGVAAMIWWSVK